MKKSISVIVTVIVSLYASLAFAGEERIKETKEAEVVFGISSVTDKVTDGIINILFYSVDETKYNREVSTRITIENQEGIKYLLNKDFQWELENNQYIFFKFATETYPVGKNFQGHVLDKIINYPMNALSAGTWILNVDVWASVYTTTMTTGGWGSGKDFQKYFTHTFVR